MIEPSFEISVGTTHLVTSKTKIVKQKKEAFVRVIDRYPSCSLKGRIGQVNYLLQILGR
jgi:hypothetical protein